MATTQELTIQIIFLEVLQRQPTIQESTDAITFLNAGNTQGDLTALLQTWDEYKKQQNTYDGNMQYDPVKWTMDLTDVFAGNYQGLMLGNGKVALMTAPSHHPIDRTYITSKFDFNEVGKYANNVIQGFEFSTFQFFDYDAAASIEISGLTQSLNMRTAIFRTTYQATDTRPGNVSSTSGVTLDVVHDIMALRQYPFCMLQSITITSSSNATVNLWHQIHSEDPVDNHTYGNQLIQGNYFFHAEGQLDPGNAAANAAGNAPKIALSNAYIFDPSGGTAVNRGYNMLRSDLRTAFNEFAIPLVAGVPYTVHLYSCTMTQHDFVQPLTECNRVLLNMLQKQATTLREEHVLAWDKQWVDCIDIEAKVGITVEETASVDETQRQIYFALYNIYSAVRDDVSVEVNPLNLSLIDLHGHLFWSAELWLIPVLLLLKPKAARVLLDYRFTMLENAKKLAAAHGYKGTKFPFENDVVGYNTVYWDTVSPLHVYNTALISIAAWNYYRITADDDWLRRKGYEILKNNADFFQSMAVYDDATNTSSIPHVYGLSGVLGDNNTVTNYLAKQAMRAAVEATYQLNYKVPPLWKQTMETLTWTVMPTDACGNMHVIQMHDNYTETPLRLLEPLLLLHPYYGRDFMTSAPPNTNYTKDIYTSNIRHYLPLLQAETEHHYWNDLMLSTLYATAAQLETTRVDKEEKIALFETHLQNLMQHASLAPWKSFYNTSAGTPTSSNHRANDLAISSMYILNLMTSIGGLRVVGGMNEARYIYEPYGIQSRTAYVMPPTWQNLLIKGVGTEEKTYSITNVLYSPGFC